MHTTDNEHDLSDEPGTGLVIRGATRATTSADTGLPASARGEARMPAPHAQHRPYTPEAEPILLLDAEGAPRSHEPVWRGAARMLAGRARARASHPSGAAASNP